MKVHLIRKESIEEFVRHNAQSRTSFQNGLLKLNMLIGRYRQIFRKLFPAQIYWEIVQTEQYLT